jgi:hypothetical protein
MFFHREGPVLTIPLPESRWRIVVDITSSPDTPRPEPPTFDEMRLIFSRRVPIAAVLTDPTWVSSFTVNRRRVSRLRSERVFLAGDAAHVHSPAGGQGMNTGMQDAFNLGWKLSLVQRGRAKTSLLDTYHDERMPVIRGVLALTDTALKLGTQKCVIADHLRSIAVPLLSGWEFVQRNVVSELSEIGIDYRRSPIVDSDGSFAADVPHAGDRAPLPPSGSDELVLSTNTHHLLLFAGDNTSEENWSMLQSLRRDFESAYPGLVHAHVIPSSSELRGKYSVVETALFLIRPDGYIAYRSSRADSVALHRFLEESYGWKAAHEEASERV